MLRRRSFAFLLMISASSTATFVGRTAGSRSLTLISLKRSGHQRRISDLSQLDVRGGGDDGRNYNNDYYGNDGRRGDYDDRGKGYYDDDDRGGNNNNPNYGYRDDGRRSNDYYGYERDNDGGKAGDYYDGADRYSQRDYYDDKGFSSSSRVKESVTSVPSIIRNGNKRVGLGLLGLGAMFTMMGITSFFNKNLLRLGNLFFVSGVPMTIGPGRTVGYFFQPKKSRATGCLVFGIFLVFVGHPVIGMALEIFGLLNLFGNMFPLAMALMRQMPIVGSLIPSGGGGSRSKTKKPQERYYEDYRDDDGPDKYY